MLLHAYAILKPLEVFVNHTEVLFGREISPTRDQSLAPSLLTSYLWAVRKPTRLEDSGENKIQA